MNIDEYFTRVAEGIEFLIAFCSIIGLLALIIGILMMLLGGQSARSKGFKIFLIGLILVIICGIYTGITYFRIT